MHHTSSYAYVLYTTLLYEQVCQLINFYAYEYSSTWKSRRAERFAEYEVSP